MISFGQIVLGILLIVLAVSFIFSLIMKRRKQAIFTSILILAYIFGNVFHYIAGTYPF